MEINEEPPHEEKSSPQRCRAHARSTGKPCRRWPLKNRTRCRLHGGLSSGARNPHRPLKHGKYTSEAIAERKAARELIRRSGELLKETE